MIGKRLFISQVSIEGDMYSPTFNSKLILDYNKIESLTCIEHVQSICCTCNCLDNNLLNSLFDNEEFEDTPCSCTFDYENMGLEILQEYIIECVNNK